MSNSSQHCRPQHTRPPCPSQLTEITQILISIEWVMPSNHLILYHPLLLLPSNLPNIRVFSNEPVLRIRWPKYWSFSISSLQSLSCAQISATPWITACQASLSITNSQSPPKPMSIELVMASNYLIFCCRLLLPSIFPSIRVFSNESALRIRWPKYWTFSFNSSLSNEHQDWSLGWSGWITLQSKSLLQHHSSKASVLWHSAFFIVQLTSMHDDWKNHSLDRPLLAK